jgi:2-oxo-3-hexenedioate decarboxylase
MDWDDAYTIQDTIRKRKEARGNKTAGLKAGLTSFAKMKQITIRLQEHFLCKLMCQLRL